MGADGKVGLCPWLCRLPFGLAALRLSPPVFFGRRDVKLWRVVVSCGVSVVWCVVCGVWGGLVGEEREGQRKLTSVALFLRSFLKELGFVFPLVRSSRNASAFEQTDNFIILGKYASLQRRREGGEVRGKEKQL